MTYMLLGCRCLIALVFLVAVLGKVRGRESYTGFVAATRRLAPTWMTARVPVSVLAAGAVTAEAGVPVLLGLPWTVPVGFVLAGALTVGFAAAISTALRRGDRAPCHCFGSADREIHQGHVIRNVLLATTAGLGLIAGGTAAGPLAPAGVAATVVAAAVLAALIVAAEGILDLFRPLS